METATKKTTWSLDPAHSEITFKVKHMMITNVSGSLQNFSLNVETEGEDFTKSKIYFSAAINSINTGNADRDKHLKSADFFNAELNPKIEFTSQNLERKDENEFVLSGDLTIAGTTRPVKFDVEFGGLGKDPWGNRKAGFTVTGKIKRTDFGLNWNAALETGGVLVGDEVKVTGEIQLIQSVTS
jgi:polyisoprenoid-binding protein YceI